MSPEELDAFLSEMEPDIRAADHDMREIELLEQKGVLSAGKLAGKTRPPPVLFIMIIISTLLTGVIAQTMRRYSHDCMPFSQRRNKT